MKAPAALALVALLAGCGEMPALSWSQGGKTSEYSAVVRLVCAVPCIRWRLSAGQRTTLDLPK